MFLTKNPSYIIRKTTDVSSFFMRIVTKSRIRKSKNRKKHSKTRFLYNYLEEQQKREQFVILRIVYDAFSGKNESYYYAAKEKRVFINSE